MPGYFLSLGARVDGNEPPIRAGDPRCDEIVAEHNRRVRAEELRFYDELRAMDAIRSREIVEAPPSPDYASTASLSTMVSSEDGYGDQCTRCGRAWQWLCPICQACRDAGAFAKVRGSMLLPYGSTLEPCDSH